MAYKTKVSWLQSAEPEIKERLKVIAKEHKRSLNSMVEVILEEWLKQYDEKNPSAAPVKSPSKRKK